MTKKNIFRVLLVLFSFVAQMTWAQAPVATPAEAITGLLNRIGGDGAASKFEIVIDASLAEGGKDVFVITSQNGKPCIKGNTQLSVATGINWYLNHYAHINLTWNNLTTDLSQVTLPVPGTEEKHVCNTTYRYNFNTCTFSYSMAFWTWERWQQEIDWMALHGINAPLNLVGLDVVTRKFLKELGVSDSDINAYIAGPGFIAWFAMNNLEGWGGTINATDVTMNGNPDWWYTRQEQLCRNMLQRMRELGMQPVIPGFSGQVPNCIVNYSINGFSSGDVVNNGTWAGGYTRPDILKPNTTSYQTFATVYYKHLHEVMGVSELYSMDPFHEGSLPSGVSNETCYPNIMVELDKYHTSVSAEDKAKNNVDEQPKWMIQYWQGVPQSGAFSAMSSYGDRFIGLDLFSDNIYAGNAAKWRDTGNNCYYKGRPYIYCMLHNFGGRSGMHGRLETTMDGYFQALANNNNCQGIGATPEGTETNPILYDMLFELPWMDVNNRPTADEWLEDYAYARYAVDKNTAPQSLSALQYLKESVWNCQRNQQGTSEAIILGRPRWTFGDVQRNDGISLEGTSVSSWSVSSIYWDTQFVLQAADDLYAIKDLITTTDGRANFDYDFIDVVRQSMVDQAAQLLPLIKEARNSGNNTEYERLYKMFLQLMLDLDEMLSYDENFKLERWTSLARNIAGETAVATLTNVNDRNWLEWNARTQVSVWSNGNNGLNDYSNRCWAGLIKDYHYPRWKYFFENNGGIKDGNWFTSEKAWTVDFTKYDYSTVTIPQGKTATEKAAETFGKYFGRVKGTAKNYIFPMGVTTNATKSEVTPVINRGQTVELPLIIGKDVEVSSVWVDLNNDGAKGNGETLTATDNQVAIPAEAKIGKTTAQVVYSDGTDITFNIALVEEITENRTVIVVAGDNGSVEIEGTNELSITNAEAVKMTATANTGYNFENWTDANSNVVSNDNPFIYYGKEEATFTANFIQDKWGVVECGEDVDGSGTVKDETAVMGDINSNNQYIHNLTLSYYNREAETIYEPTAAPTSIFTTVPQIVNVPQGASFTVAYGNRDNFKHCYFRAYIDLNADGDFDDEGELLKEVGSKGAQNTAVCSNSINVLLPYDMPLGITHMRLRFDSAWNIGENAKSPCVRPVYELIINVTDGSAKAAHVVVESNNDAWGTAEVWTEETPGWTASNEWDVSTGIYAKIKATKASEDVEFLGWYDHYGRLLTTELAYSMLAREDATYTAKFRKALDIDGWEFEYRTEPGVVILTSVRKSGNHDLVIPETVEIMGEQYKIVGFDNGVFNNNKDLWSISLPSTIETLSNNVVFRTSVKGENTPTSSGDNNPDNKVQVIDLGFTLKKSEAWTIRATYKSDGVSTFNQWGSPLLYPNGDGTGSELFYLSNVNGWSDCWHVRSPFSGLGNNYFKDLTNAKIATFTVLLENKGTGKAVITVTNSEGQSKTSSDVTFSYDNISAFSAKLPKGLDITKFEVLQGAEPDPFEGCTNLLDITIADGGCNGGYTVDGREFKNVSGVVLHTLANKDKEQYFRTLGALIDNTKALMDVIATSVDPVGKANGLSLTTQGQDFYVSSNADQNTGGGSNDGGGIAALVDNNEGTYFHTRWGGTEVNEPHYIQVDLGANNLMNNFKFTYKPRSGSPAPTAMTVYGSSDGTNFTDVLATINSGLPAHNSGNTYESAVIDSKHYRYLRFTVTGSAGPGNAQYGGQYFFGMLEFDLFKLTSTVEVADVYKNLASITNDAAANVYDNLANALYVYNNGGTAAELQAAYNALEPLYTELNKKKNSVLNGVYHINYNDAPTFVGYSSALTGLTGATEGYRMFDGTTGNTEETHKSVHDAAIAAKVAADELFTIVPNSAGTGYTISAQGLYMMAVGQISEWCVQSFDTDEANAGVYLIEDASNDVFKLKCANPKENWKYTNYVNDWGPVFGNDRSNKPNLSNFSFTPVTEYTLTVPANGVTTLCMPFNVVLPQGVTAYDLAEGDLTSYDNCTGYTLSEVAVGGETLAKNTPVIIKATAADYTLTITMDEEGAKGSKDGSVLRSAVAKTTVAAADTTYTFDGENFNVVGTDTEVAANQCWMELDANCGQKIFTTEYAFPTVLIPTDESRDQLLSNITWGSTIGTFSAPYPTVIPAGVTAYYATQEYNGGVVSLTPVGENLALPANQGVILIGESDKTNLLFVPAAGETVADLSSNTMSNSAATSVVMGNSDYILANDDQGIGIYQATPGTTLKQGKAFFRLPAAQGVNSLVLNFGGSATGIESAQIQLLDGDAVYDIYGRRVTHINKSGIYIKNGKKFIVK